LRIGEGGRVGASPQLCAAEVQGNLKGGSNLHNEKEAEWASIDVVSRRRNEIWIRQPLSSEFQSNSPLRALLHPRLLFLNLSATLLGFLPSRFEIRFEAVAAEEAIRGAAVELDEFPGCQRPSGAKLDFCEFDDPVQAPVPQSAEEGSGLKTFAVEQVSTGTRQFPKRLRRVSKYLQGNASLVGL